MPDRQTIARAAADALETARASLPGVLVGFDGFIDSIVHMVDVRNDMSPTGYRRLATIAAFAARCAAASGTSTNIERVTLEDRFGGNGPLMAGALAAVGAPTTFVGAVGSPSRREGVGGWAVAPLFAPFAQRCTRCLAIAEPSHTLCLEFDDGKLMFNDTANVQAVTWPRLLSIVGLDPLRRMVADATLIGIVNWSLLGGVEGIWDGLRTQVFEPLATTHPRERRIFIDLSDPAKRLDADLHRCLTLLRQLEETPGVSVTLGLNLAESRRFARLLGIAPPNSGPSLADSAAALREATALDTIAIHPREGAACATRASSSWFDGPFTRSPALSTGAGDHFNAGFGLGQTLNLDPSQCLAVGCALSGAYVRDARSPDLSRLLAFLRDLPNPEP